MMPSGDMEVVLDAMSEVPLVDADASDTEDAVVVDDNKDVAEDVEFVDSVTDVCDREDVVGEIMAVEELCDVVELVELEPTVAVVDVEAASLVPDPEDTVDEGA